MLRGVAARRQLKELLQRAFFERRGAISEASFGVKYGCIRKSYSFIVFAVQRSLRTDLL
jgi:hypothetical protein